MPPAAATSSDAPMAVSFELDDLTVRPAVATVAPGGTVKVVDARATPAAAGAAFPDTRSFDANAAPQEGFTVPGPVIRGTVGDTFRVRFIDDAGMPHSIDVHASKVAPNDEMRTIDPGEELRYESRRCAPASG